MYFDLGHAAQLTLDEYFVANSPSVAIAQAATAGDQVDDVAERTLNFDARSSKVATADAFC